MSDSMIERVSRVLCECAGFDPDEPVVMLSKPDGKGARWGFYEPTARAAIEAMRKPTEAMWNAPGRSDAFVNGIVPTGEESERIYQAMIDEALK